MNRSEAFRILGVSETASPEEIKKAYRRHASRCHPDKHSTATPEEKKKYEEEFKRIKMALDIIEGNVGSQKGPGSEWATWNFSTDPSADFAEILRNMGFNAGNFGFNDKKNRPKVDPIDEYQDNWGGSGPGAGQQKKSFYQYTVHIPITLEEAFTGCVKQIDVPNPNSIAGTPTQIKIPKGLSNGERFQVFDTPDGRLLLHVKIVSTEYSVQYNGPFNVNGAGNVYREMKVDPFILLMGGNIHVKTLDGSTVSVRVPAGLSLDSSLKLQGKGYWSSTKLQTRGDCYLKLIPEIKRLQDYPQDRLKEVAAEIDRLIKQSV